MSRSFNSTVALARQIASQSTLVNHLLQLNAVAHVHRRWPKSDLSEARLLVEIMELIPSKAWDGFVGPAQHQRIRHWQLLLEHQDRIYEQIAEAAADEDGLTTAAEPTNEHPRTQC